MGKQSLPAITKRSPDQPWKVGSELQDQNISRLPGIVCMCQDRCQPILHQTHKSEPDRSEPDAQTSIQKRAPRRYISKALAARLCTLDSPLRYRYRLTFYDCSEVITQTDGTLRTEFCGYGWCAVCGAIRMAKYITAYGPVIAEWTDPQFVTLTRRTVPRAELPERIESMKVGFANINRRMKRRFGSDWKAIRKRETKFMAHSGDYHHHYHLVVQGKEQAECLRSFWLATFPDDAKLQGNDIRPADSGSLTELLKYTTKLTAEDGKSLANIEALDWIFQCMAGKPVLNRYGFEIPKEIADDIDSESITDTVGTPAWKHLESTTLWKFDALMMDWFNPRTGEALSGYVPTPEVLELRGNIERKPVAGPVVPEVPSFPSAKKYILRPRGSVPNEYLQRATRAPEPTDYVGTTIGDGELPFSGGCLNFLSHIPTKHSETVGTTEAPELFVKVIRTKQTELSPG